MPLQVDPRDLVISQLAVKLLLSDARADDAEARVRELEAQLVDRVASPSDVLGGTDARVHRDSLDNDRANESRLSGLGVEAEQVQEEEERHNSPLASSNGHAGQT